MSQIITVTNQKGGVGKTTVAAALVCGLHQRGARVLGVDIDPQGNLAFTLGLDIGSGHTVYDVLKGACSIEAAITPTEYGDVLPSCLLHAWHGRFQADVPADIFLVNTRSDAGYWQFPP